RPPAVPRLPLPGPPLRLRRQDRLHRRQSGLRAGAAGPRRPGPRGADGRAGGASRQDRANRAAGDKRGAADMTGGHRFDPTILREYDIRGVVGTTLRAADAHAVGRSFGTMVRNRGGRAVAVGYDGRLSSPDLEAAMV